MVVIRTHRLLAGKFSQGREQRFASQLLSGKPGSTRTERGFRDPCKKAIQHIGSRRRQPREVCRQRLLLLQYKESKPGRAKRIVPVHALGKGSGSTEAFPQPPDI